jgi:hypothetical protein
MTVANFANLKTINPTVIDRRYRRSQKRTRPSFAKATARQAEVIPPRRNKKELRPFSAQLPSQGKL